MEVKILSNEKNVLELDLGSIDQSVVQLLAEKLNDDKDVEVASFKVDHPIIGTPRFFVRVKKGDPVKMVLDKLEEIKKEVTDFQTQFVDIAK